MTDHRQEIERIERALVQEPNPIMRLLLLEERRDVVRQQEMERTNV